LKLKNADFQKIQKRAPGSPGPNSIFRIVALYFIVATRVTIAIVARDHGGSILVASSLVIRICCDVEAVANAMMDGTIIAGI
jgi:hypothetical protein